MLGLHDLENDNITPLLFKAINEKAIISITDADGVITKVNKLFCELSQYTKDELIGKTHSVINSSYHNYEFWELFWKTIKTGNTWCGEVKNCAKDGTFYWVDCTVYPIEKNGVVEGYISIRYNITDKKNKEFEQLNLEKKLEKSLKKERANLYAIINNTRDVIVSINKEFKIIEFNEAMRKQVEVNFNFQAQKGNYILDFVNENRHQKLITIFERVLQGEHIIDKEEFPISYINDVVYFETSYFPIIDPNTKISGIVIFSRDITQKLKTEKALINSENQLQAIFNSSSNIHTFIDKNYKIISLNKEAKNAIKGILNIDVKPGDSILSFAIGKELNVFKNNYKDALSGIKVKYERNVIFENGIDIWVEIEYFPVYDHEKKLIGVSCNATDVSARKRQSLEIEKIKTLLETTNKVAKIGSWDYNLRNGKVECSEEFYKIFGITEKEKIHSLGDVFREKSSAEDFQELMKKFQESVDTEITFNFEHKITSNNGSIKYILSIGEVYKNGDNIIIGVTGVVQDITERKKIEFKNERFSLIAKNSKEAIVITNNEKKITWVNDAFTKNTEYTLEESIGKSPAELLQFEGSNRKIIRLISEELNKCKSVKCEILNRSKYGKLYWVDLNIQPLFDKNNKQIGFFSIQSDITERKILENNLRKSSKLLNDTNKLAMIGSWQYDLNTKEVTCNVITKLIHEASQKYQPTIKDSIRYLTNTEDIRMIKKAIKELILNRKRCDLEYEIITRKGTRKWVRTIGDSQFIGGKCVRIYGIIQDITERKKFNGNLLAKQKAERANEIKSEFLANMSHEIRTPMNAILGFASLLKKISKNPRQQEYIEGIRAGGVNLMTLINNILDLSKIEAEQIDIIKVKTNLRSLVDELKSILAAKLIEEENELIIGFANDIPSIILIDEFHLKQVLINIIGNAIKFTRNGKIYLTIESKYAESNYFLSELTFTVRDTGIGISKEKLLLIFEPFKQIDSSWTKKYEGTGLGLSISKKLVELMGGEIIVDSEINKGSEFKIIFENVEFKELITEEPALLLTSHYDFRNATLLLVEDIFSNREVIKCFLENSNLTIIEAENGKIALELLKEMKPDIILIDMMMPEMNGFETSKAIRVNADTKETPIIAITALSPCDETSEKFENCTDYLRKPIDEMMLLDTIAKYLPHEKTIYESDNVVMHYYLKIINKKKFHELFYNLFNDVDSIRSNDEILQMVNQMHVFAKENSEPYLKTFCTILTEHITKFDIDKINLLMDRLKQEF